MVEKNHSEKYEFVNWDDEIPNIHGKIENGNQTTNQVFYGDIINQKKTMGPHIVAHPRLTG